MVGFVFGEARGDANDADDLPVDDLGVRRGRDIEWLECRGAGDGCGTERFAVLALDFFRTGLDSLDPELFLMPSTTTQLL